MRGAVFGLAITVLASACLFPSLDGLTGGSCDACGEDANESDGANETATDGAIDQMTMDVGGDGSPAPTLVHATGAAPSGSTVNVPIPVTNHGDLLVVALTTFGDSGNTVNTIQDGTSDVFTSAGERSTNTSCQNTAEIWYSKNIAAGAGSVTVSLSSSVNVQIWILELSGVSSGMDKGGVSNNQGTTTTLVAPTVTVGPNEAVVSVVAACSNVGPIASGNPFAALPLERGDDAAFYITAAAGTFGAVWSSSGSGYNSSTVAFY